MRILTGILFTTILFIGSCSDLRFNSTREIQYCINKAEKTLAELGSPDKIPRNIKSGEQTWGTSRITSWTAGFWSGILWYIYEFTEDEKWLNAAKEATATLEPIKQLHFKTHDLGFMMHNSYGHGYRVTNDSEYRDILLETADSLALLYNEKAGTLLSWPWMVEKKGWQHNTIIDNIMNLNLLFWAAKNGRPDYYNIAVTHANNTRKHFIRNDFSTWQVVVFDTIHGDPIQKLTFQGLSDQSTWARGQAWAIYGYVMTYRETSDPSYLETAQKLADAFIAKLPEDLIPYWDLDVIKVENKVKDASAAAIATSALLDLATLVKDQDMAKSYFRTGQEILNKLSSSKYKSNDENNAFLMHSVGSFPANSEVDVSIIYTDYYYLEALVRYHNLVSNNIF